MERTLYERLGGRPRIAALTNDLVDLHLANPAIRTRFLKYDLAEVKRKATEFMCMGTGGPETYTGQGLVRAHEGMNISADEFLAVMDDVALVLERHGVGARERQEIITTFMDLRKEVLHL
jgi:hemoglobin